MINRTLYKGYFTKEDMSKWQCPICNGSALKVVEEYFIKKNNSATHEYQPDIPEKIVSTFTALLSCTNPQCKEVVTCSGTGFVEGYFNNCETKYIEYFNPYFFYPPLNIFQIPEKTPENVKESILSSFSLIFTNKSSAANQIRIALECLLTHLKVEQYPNQGQKKRLSLHDRIKLLPKQYEYIRDICSAIKWLGNAGSHCDDRMTLDDVFDGYDMLSFVLEELYDNKHPYVTKLAKKINAKRGV